MRMIKDGTRFNPWSVWRSNLERIVDDYRRAATVVVDSRSRSGRYDDIRPTKFKWHSIVSQLRAQYVLPDIVMPHTAYLRPWLRAAHRKYMKNFYLPVFG